MIDFTKPFEPKSLGPTMTSAPTNAAEIDSPPGAPDYANGPLANPRPKPTPQPPPSLSTLAAGGFNHAEAWMAGMQEPPAAIEQKPFESTQGYQRASGTDDAMNPFTFSASYSPYGK